MKALLVAVFAVLSGARRRCRGAPAGPTRRPTRSRRWTTASGSRHALPAGRARAAGERARRDALPRARRRPAVGRPDRAALRRERLRRAHVRLPRPRPVGRPLLGLGARELADVATLRERGCPRTRRSSDRVGAWGISLGGGALCARSARATPFAALEVVETWTDLYDALVPQGLPKSGAIFQFLGAVPRERQSPELLALSDAVARATSRAEGVRRRALVAPAARPRLPADALLPGTPGLRVRARPGLAG